MFLPDLNNRENHKKIRSQGKKVGTILRKMIGLLWNKGVHIVCQLLRSASIVVENFTV